MTLYEILPVQFSRGEVESIMTEIVYSAICWPGGDTFSLSPPSSRRHFLERNRGSFLEPQLNIKPKRPVAAPCFGGIDLTRFAGRRKLKQLLVAWQEPMGSCRLVYVIKPKILFLFTDVSLTVIIGKKHSVD